jgi:drug/metabolite transporter (DMT)-like permease
MPPPASTPRKAASPKSREGARTLAYGAWIVVCIVWGTTYLAIRVALESVPVALVGGLRFTAAGLILIAALRLTGQPLPPPRTWSAIALSGFLLLVIGNGAVVWAEQYVASGLTAVIVAMVPFWNVVVEAIRPDGERPTARTMFGLAIGFAGIIVLVWPELFTETSGNWFVAGVIALQLACAGWAVGTSFTKRNAASSSPAATSAMQMLAAGVMFLAIATVTGEWTQLTFTVRSAGAVLYLVVFGSIVAFSAYVYALKHLPIATVSLYSYVNPLIAVVLGSVLLSEPFSSRTLAASALVFAGIAVVRSASEQTGGSRQARPEPGRGAA